jgi:hypothetical protein
MDELAGRGRDQSQQLVAALGEISTTGSAVGVAVRTLSESLSAGTLSDVWDWLAACGGVDPVELIAQAGEPELAAALDKVIRASDEFRDATYALAWTLLTSCLAEPATTQPETRQIAAATVTDIRTRRPVVKRPARNQVWVGVDEGF